MTSVANACRIYIVSILIRIYITISRTMKFLKVFGNRLKLHRHELATKRCIVASVASVA